MLAQSSTTRAPFMLMEDSIATASAQVGRTQAGKLQNPAPRQRAGPDCTNLSGPSRSAASTPCGIP